MRPSQAADSGSPGTQTLRIVNLLDDDYGDDIAQDVREGMSSRQKCIPSKYFYDENGSMLFEEICRLPEYYPTRTEMEILSRKAENIMQSCDGIDLIELGSGSDRKVRTLLNAAGESRRGGMRYIPVDISESAILKASEDLSDSYPELEVIGVVGDFTRLTAFLGSDRRKILCFLGSTIGNLSDEECATFLRHFSTRMETSDRMLVGFDMVKDIDIIESAYNDEAGVTARFNKNILHVVNSELDADFDLDDFEHHAFFNKEESRIEMHLVARRSCTVRIDALETEVEFSEGETIHTENSRKFTRESIERIASEAGFEVRERYTDSREWFSLASLGPNSPQ